MRLLPLVIVFLNQRVSDAMVDGKSHDLSKRSIDEIQRNHDKCKSVCGIDNSLFCF